MMNKNEFNEAMREAVESRIRDKGLEVSAELRDVAKDNGTTRTGIVFAGESRIQPVLYIDGLFKEYQDGRGFEEIADSMADLYMESGAQADFNLNMITDWEQAKEHVQVCVRNAEMNKELLQDVPHEMVGDLAVLYRVQLDNCPGDTTGSVLIHNGLLQAYGVDQETLNAQAWKNTREQNSYSCKSMFETLTGMMPGLADDMPADVMENMDMRMYVLTNQSKTNGACYMCDKETLAKVAEALESNLIMLPSSIHECIVLPDNGAHDMDELRSMVHEVNETQLEPGEVLSGNVYTYNAQTQEIGVYDGQDGSMVMGGQQ